MQIVEGVFQFKIPMPVPPHPHPGLKYTLVYLINTREGWVMVDAGLDTDEGFQAFQEQLGDFGINPRDITILVATHGHADHEGLAGRIKEYTGARLAMHKLDSTGRWDPAGDAMSQSPDSIHGWLLRMGVPSRELSNHFFSRHRHDFYIHGSTWDGHVPNVDIFLEDGDEIIPESGLFAIWTPGHSPGHLCIYDQSRHLVFSGDHILPTITSHFCLNSNVDRDPLGLYLTKHQYIKDLNAIMALPAHEYTIHNVGQRINEILAYHQHRMQEILDHVNDSPKTAWQIAKNLPWTEDAWNNLGSGTRRMALMETIAHLEHLTVKGRLAIQDTNTEIQYSLLN